MKKINLVLSVFAIIFFAACSDVEPLDPSLLSNSGGNSGGNTGGGGSGGGSGSGGSGGGSGSGGGTSSGYAMTAVINGQQFFANNPFGNNQFSSTNIWSYFPLSDFVMLQGRQGGILGNPEINIWLKRNDIVVGTYSFGPETFSTPPSHFIDLIDNSVVESQYTESGSITITQVNTSTKTVTGTFQFTTLNHPASDPSATQNNTVTNGTFNYIYMN